MADATGDQAVDRELTQEEPPLQESGAFSSPAANPAEGPDTTNPLEPSAAPVPGAEVGIDGSARIIPQIDAGEVQAVMETPSVNSGSLSGFDSARDGAGSLAISARSIQPGGSASIMLAFSADD